MTNELMITELSINKKSPDLHRDFSFITDY